MTASAGAALATIIVKRAHLQVGVVAMTGWHLAIGSAPLLVAAGIWPAPSPVQWTAEFWGILLFLALLGTALPTTLWFWLLREEDAGKLAAFLFLTPVLGLVLGVAVFGDRIVLLQGAGVLIILAGLVAAAREKSQVPLSAAQS